MSVTSSYRLSSIMVQFIVILLLVVKFPRLSTSSTNQESLHPLYLVVLVPYPQNDSSVHGNPSWSGGLNVLPAVRLAVDHIQSSDILEGYKLELIEKDCGCNFTNRARVSFMESVIYNKSQIVGLIGPGCSASTVAIAPLTAQNNISLVHIHGAGTPKLEDHKKYPYSFGIFGSSQGVVATIIALMQDRGWNRVAVLYDSSRVFQSSTHDALVASANTMNISLISEALISNYDYLAQIHKKRIRIVLVLAGPQLARNLMCLALKRYMTFPVIQWVIIERPIAEFEMNVSFYHLETFYECSREDMLKNALNGSLLITYRLANYNKSAPTLMGNGISYEQFLTNYTNEIDNLNAVENQNLTTSPWGSMYYDAVWAMAIALDNAQSNDSFNLDEYGIDGIRQMSATLKLHQEVHKLNFSGVSGPVLFNKETGYNERPFDISQIFNSTAELLGYFNGGDSIFNLSNNVNTVPDEYPQVVQLTKFYVTILLGLVTLVIFFITVTFHITAVCQRNKYFVRASSLRLSQLAYFGCYFLSLTSFTHITVEGVYMDDTSKYVLCHITYVLCSIGFTLVFGTTCVKTWRLYRIFNHSWKPGKLLSDRFLFVLVLLAPIGDILINILWISFDRFTIEEHILKEVFDGRVITVEKHCSCTLFRVWYSLIYGYNFILIGGACILALCTNKSRITGFQTNTVVKMSYVLFFLMGIGIPFQVILQMDTHLDHIVIYLADYIILNTVVLITNFFLFMPPVIPKLNKAHLGTQCSFTKQTSLKKSLA